MVTETLPGTGTRLTSFYFLHGGNLYAFSYGADGNTRHTFVDTGDPRYGNRLVATLVEHGIDPGKTDNVLITHHHADHCGLAGLLAGASKAKVLVHAKFKDFVEGRVPPGERLWFGESSVAQFRDLDLVYLSPREPRESIEISGVRFPSLGEPIRMGGGQLRVLACPEGALTHTPDQMLFLYSANPAPFKQTGRPGNLLPTDDVLFTGDLWLMRGPQVGPSLWHLGRRLRHKMAGFGHQFPKDHREQDSRAKEALKKGFCLVRVKPGHGGDFLGSRIISCSLLADRDMLLELGYSPAESTAVLQEEDEAPRVTATNERAYAYFVGELGLWLQLGYSPDDVRTLLVRIYAEQTGGIPSVRRDRTQRRKKLRQMLFRLSQDQSRGSRLQVLAQSTMAMLDREGADGYPPSMPIPSHWTMV